MQKMLAVPAADVLVIRPADAAGTHRYRRSGRVVKLDRPLVETYDGLTRAMRAGVQAEHVLHPAHELLVDLRQTPNFFPARASTLAWPASVESLRGRSCPRCRDGSPPPREAACSNAAVPSAAARTPTRRRPPLGCYRACGRASAAGPRSARAASRPADTASPRARSLAGTRRLRWPSLAPCAHRRAAAAREPVAKSGLSAAFCSVASAPTRTDLAPKASAPRTASSSPYARDQTSISAASPLWLVRRGPA